MNNLNKENYFTEKWTANYPKTSADFYKFVDRYKKEVNWPMLFNQILITDGKANVLHESVAPEFHEIPLELQFGIISKWLQEKDPGGWLPCPVDIDAIIEELDWYMKHFEEKDESSELCENCGWAKKDHTSDGRCYHYSDQDTDYFTDYFYVDKYFKAKTK